jgi:restriction system protein
MTIPDFQSVMRPLLEHLSDGQDRTNRETLDALALRFGLSDNELSELIPSGRQPLFYNRVAWAKTHLKAAGCVESPKRGVYRITERGQQLLDDEPDRVGLGHLKQYPEYQEFRKPKKEDDAEPAPEEDSSMTPEEHLEYGYRMIRDELAAELLRQVKECSPGFFESLVVELLLAMGYGGSRSDAGQIVGKSGDGGVDGVIKEDRLGLDIIYIQAKRWEGVVGRPEIQKFAGALQGQRAKKGVFITTSGFSREAEEFVSSIESKIVLVDGDRLAQFMIDFGIGVSMAASYEICRLDSDYFEPA